jgi:glycosyltransferase involved in cell wall biosynthesis
VVNNIKQSMIKNKINNRKRQRLMIVTTVPDTLMHILRDQPRFLNQHFEVSITTSIGPGKMSLDHEGVRVCHIPMQRGIHLICDIWSVLLMVCLLIKVRPLIVHSYTPKAGLVSMLAAWVCRVPVRVHTFTGLIWPTTSGWRRRMLMSVDKVLCACATQIIPEGQGVKRDLERGRITTKNLQTIGNGNIAGVNVEYFSSEAKGLAAAASSLRKSYGVNSEDFVYIFIGRLNKDKGLDELIFAFERLPDNCRLLVVGDVDKTAPASKISLQSLQTHARIHWLGFLQDIRPALKAADVLVLPSYREGFPNVVLQAGSMRLPVIATDINGCNEVIETGVNGWLVPVRDAIALEDKMRVVYHTHQDVLQKMGNSARARIIKNFEQHAHWNRMLNFYKSLIFGFPNVPNSKEDV